MSNTDNLRTLVDGQDDQQLSRNMNEELRTNSRRNSIDRSSMAYHQITPLSRSVEGEQAIQSNESLDNSLIWSSAVHSVNDTYPLLSTSITAHTFFANSGERFPYPIGRLCNTLLTVGNVHSQWFNIFGHQSPTFDNIPFGIADTQAPSMAASIIDALNHWHEDWVNVEPNQIREAWVLVNADTGQETIDDSAD